MPFIPKIVQKFADWAKFSSTPSLYFFCEEVVEKNKAAVLCCSWNKA